MGTLKRGLGVNAKSKKRREPRPFRRRKTDYTTGAINPCTQSFINLCVLYVFMVCALKRHGERSRVKRVQVTFTGEQWSLVERFRGVMGNDDAEIVRNIVLTWLTEKSVVTESVKRSLGAEGGTQR